MSETLRAPRCPFTGVAASTAYTTRGCRCEVCRAWKSEKTRLDRARYGRTEADREYDKLRRTDPERSAANSRVHRARQRALKQLAKNHAEEFRSLYSKEWERLEGLELLGVTVIPNFERRVFGMNQLPTPS